MATHSSILAWRIPWTEEPVGYGSQGHKESDRTEAKISMRAHVHRTYINSYFPPLKPFIKLLTNRRD